MKAITLASAMNSDNTLKHAASFTKIVKKQVKLVKLLSVRDEQFGQLALFFGV